MKVIVTKPHTSNYSNPICFKEGDSLGLGELDTEYPNWIKVSTPDGNKGWAPLQYINRGALENRGIATTDYEARELNTSEGEELNVLFELNMWFKVVNPEGVVGWVPTETVKNA